MSIQEIEVFPQITLSDAAGLVGVRKWLLDASDNLRDFLNIICASHFPGWQDSPPTQIQSGPFWEGTQIWSQSARTYESMGYLPQYNKIMVVAQYALRRMTNCWPTSIPKPAHLTGTTLTLKVKGSGQVLLVSPAGMGHGVMNAMTSCTEGVEGLSAAAGTRIIIPIAEYHITCDRMTDEQVDDAMQISWDRRLGCVNGETEESSTNNFLGADRGTLLFDGYEINETSVCDMETPYRHSMTAVFKKRVIVDSWGAPLKDDDDVVVGWNHDFVNKTVENNPSKIWGWKYIKLRQGDQCVERYPYDSFALMFGGVVERIPCGAEIERPAETILYDNELCVPENPG